MKILIVHFSDIHLTPTNNDILRNVDQLTNSFQNFSLECDAVFVVVTGDIAFSGLDIEYTQATILLDSIASKIKKYSKKNINFILIPGNHDCNLKPKTPKRDSYINNILKEKNPQSISSTIIDQCSEPQKGYFAFSAKYKSGESIHSDKLVNILEFTFDTHNIIFNCYNTAWLSHKNENETYFPLEMYDSSKFLRKADIRFTVLHHSHNWFTYLNLRQFKKHIEETSDIILTGHEHIPSKSLKSDLEGKSILTLEGYILQEHGKSDASGFNVVWIDLKNSQYQIHNFGWSSDFYSCTNSPQWKPLPNTTATF